MTTSTICQTAAAARESARQSTGKFGEQAHSNPGRDLVEKATHIAKSEWSRTSSWGRTGVADYDDFAQDAMLELLERRAKAGDRTADAAHGGIEIDVSDWATSASGANMRQVAKRSMRIMYLGEKNGNAVGARRKLAELDREFTAQHGRPMNDFERVEAAERVLKVGGRLAVVTFHSLEDRIVKAFFTARAGKTPGGSRHLPPVEAVDGQEGVERRGVGAGDADLLAHQVLRLFQRRLDSGRSEAWDARLQGQH